jgi:hypothetical protein
MEQEMEQENCLVPERHENRSFNAALLSVFEFETVSNQLAAER